MSEMEPEVKRFLTKIVWTIFWGLVWMTVNTLIGIKWGYALFEGRYRIGNYLFYPWFVISLTALLRYYYITWKDSFNAH